MVSIWADWETAEGTGALGQPEPSACAPRASCPHLPALLRTGTSRGYFTWPDRPQRTCPQHALQTPVWPGPGGPAVPWAEHPGEHWFLRESPPVKIHVHGVFRRRAPLLTLAPAPAMQRQNSSWDSLVVSGILLQASTQLKHCPEMFAGKLLL